MGPIAVIDLGSNTFHLLICTVHEDGTFTPVYKSRGYVKLASGGLGFIDPESEARGLSVMSTFADKLKEHNVHTVKAVGTSALREASNGQAVVDRYFQATGIKVDIIGGLEEADYILGGTRAALPALDRHGLIMDIGGGSVEFILFHEEEIAFKGSYKCGVSVLYKLFHQTDPMSPANLKALETYVGDQVSDLFEALQKVDSYYLIGSSGSFEVIQDMLPHLSTDENWSELDITHFNKILDHIISSDLAHRKTIPEIPAERLDYVVVAFALIRFITQKFPPQRLFYCDFALKEGVLAEIASKSTI